MIGSFGFVTLEAWRKILKIQGLSQLPVTQRNELSP
jgi:hypothetical protein